MTIICTLHKAPLLDGECVRCAREDEMIRILVKIKTDRDALLAACRAAWTNYGRNGDISVDALAMMEAAIKSAEEE